MQGSSPRGHPPLFSQVHQQETGLQMEKAGLKLEHVQDAVAISDNFTCYTTVPVFYFSI